MYKQLSVTLGQKRCYSEIVFRANITSSTEPALLTKAVDKSKPLPKLTR